MNTPSTDKPSRAEWPQISDIIPNHGADRPAPTTALAGLRVTVYLESAVTVQIRSRELTWGEGGSETAMEYEAFSLDDGLYYVDAIPAAPNRQTFTLLWDMQAMRALVVQVTLPEPQEAQSAVLDRLARTGSQSAVRVRYRQGGIDTEAFKPFVRSGALAGLDLRYVYSTTHDYEHIYHSDKFYSWFCHEGPDKGLGDFEECDVFDIRDKLYLVSWREKLLPCVGIMVENHQSMRSVGKICGADAYTGVIGNTRVGAAIRRAENR